MITMAVFLLQANDARMDVLAVAPARGGGGRGGRPDRRQDRFWDSAKFVEKYVAGGSIINVGKIELFIYFVKNIGG